MNVRRNLLVLMILGAAATPVLAQSVSSVKSSAGSAIPDFSGMWVHPYFPGIEPPASGPGPVLNRSRRPNGTGNSGQFVGDYSNPALKAEAAQVVKQHGDISLAGQTYGTPSNRCWPSGVPYIFFQPGMEMLQQQDRVVFLYMRDHEVRHVRLNQLHPAQVTPSWYGDSVGHYEGDTLVIDTVGVKTDRPFAMVDMYGTPYSKALHVVKRYRLLDYEAAKKELERAAKENFRLPPDSIPPAADSDPNYRGKHLQLQFTVEDEGVLTTAWSATITYGRPAVGDRRGTGAEYVCAENPNYAGKKPAVPTANRPDF